MIIGNKLARYKTIDSTNAEARRLIVSGEGEGLVVIAAKQTKGRGKPGAKWLSPLGNLYLSAVVKPFKNPQDIAPLTLLGAVAARSAITRLAKLAVVIKWPNDLLIHGKKVGGILTERLASGFIIIGIGINVNSLPAEMERTATSLKKEGKKIIDLKKLESGLIAELDNNYDLFLRKM
ncbi:MAG: biotin--[acetyl-CoA-carboxylase] ligase [Candidatus Margulisbacteria bacterium]|nr:biotin--[acetyl-CoA-carboxylase] ligase [Candidatus Margulisiibacteriota bacterium]